jgi:hypothetical protein
VLETTNITERLLYTVTTIRCHCRNKLTDLIMLIYFNYEDKVELIIVASYSQIHNMEDFSCDINNNGNHFHYIKKALHLKTCEKET